MHTINVNLNASVITTFEIQERKKKNNYEITMREV